MSYFDINTYSHCFKTEANEAYFWHGQTTTDGNNYQGQDNAAEIASAHNGKTLEMCMLEHREELEKAGVRFEPSDGELPRISYGNNDEENEAFWRDCSAAFAQQASGDVHVIEGEDVRFDNPINGHPEIEGQLEIVPEAEYQKSTWATIEHPELEKNEKVTSISQVDAVSGEETGKVEKFDRNTENTYDYDYGIGW